MSNFCKLRRPFPATTTFSRAVPRNSQPKPSTDRPEILETKQRVEVGFRELADGTFVEAIENPTDPSKSSLVIFKNGQVRYAEELVDGDQLLVPLSKRSETVRHVRFANGCERYESAMNLIELLIVILSWTLDLSPEQILLLSSWTLSTYFVETLPIAPYVALIGPPGSGKTTALRVLNLLCWRSLLTADISSAAFYETCDRLTTTALIDEIATVNNRRELFHLLRVGSSQDLVAFRKGRSYRSYGARAISLLTPLDDEALNSRCIFIPMKSCVNQKLLSPSDPRVLSLAALLRRQLMHFRLSNFKTLKSPPFCAEQELLPRTRDIFTALASPLHDEPDLCKALLACLTKQQSLRRLLSGDQSAAVDCLFEIIHNQPGIHGVRIAELAKTVNEDLRQRGEAGKLSERKLGSVLTSLNLTNRTRTCAGYVLWLDRGTRESIHSLARQHGTKTAVKIDLAAGCDICGRAKTGSTNGTEIKSAAKNNGRQHREAAKNGSERSVRGKANYSKPARSACAAKSMRRTSGKSKITGIGKRSTNRNQ
jgi:energy-coupling factor transporter ATP-binding protein EcfA2